MPVRQRDFASVFFVFHTLTCKLSTPGPTVPAYTHPISPRLPRGFCRLGILPRMVSALLYRTTVCTVLYCAVLPYCSTAVRELSSGVANARALARLYATVTRPIFSLFLLASNNTIDGRDWNHLPLLLVATVL